VPIGLLPNREYDERTFQAEPGDLLILFSDGVSDHLSPTGEEYGRTGLTQVMRRCTERMPPITPQEVVTEIFADLDRFNTERFDDQTLIVMRVQ
jgi:serine phosphatase RsbU (regulator of sigma subunit)